ncbi:hypothetical protein EDC01DRAFT_222215 [Geopyxis carbonaria]|nr:hypothetical protein EDC01DRAFT_222215 [Geopyxis carbonaria]
MSQTSTQVSYNGIPYPADKTEYSTDGACSESHRRRRGRGRGRGRSIVCERKWARILPSDVLVALQTTALVCAAGLHSAPTSTQPVLSCGGTRLDFSSPALVSSSSLPLLSLFSPSSLPLLSLFSPSSLHLYMSLATTTQCHNHTTTQPHNHSTTQPLNHTTTQPLVQSTPKPSSASASAGASAKGRVRVHESAPILKPCYSC